jgi:hypothetical protein
VAVAAVVLAAEAMAVVVLAVDLVEDLLEASVVAVI